MKKKKFLRKCSVNSNVWEGGGEGIWIAFTLRPFQLYYYIGVNYLFPFKLLLRPRLIFFFNILNSATNSISKFVGLL